MERKFGASIEATTLKLSDYLIAPLPDASAALEEIRREGLVIDGWIDPPRESRRRLGRYGERSNAWLFYHLPFTHSITSSRGGEEADREIEFVVTLYGFLTGTRLIPEGWSHFHRVPIGTRSLVDFRCSPTALERMLESAQVFRTGLRNAMQRKILFAAVHWYLIAKCYEQEYESFAAMYTSFEACWRLWCEVQGREYWRDEHSKRPQTLSAALGVRVPDWASKPATGKSPLAEVRNSLIHEGLYGGEPVGFAFPAGDFDFDLAPLVSRLLLALVCGMSPYTASPITAQVHYIDV